MPVIHRVRLCRNDEVLEIGVHQDRRDTAKAVSMVTLKYKPDGWTVDAIDGRELLVCKQCGHLITDVNNSVRLSGRVAYCGPCFLIVDKEFADLADVLCVPAS